MKKYLIALTIITSILFITSINLYYKMKATVDRMNVIIGEVDEVTERQAQDQSDIWNLKHKNDCAIFSPNLQGVQLINTHIGNMLVSLDSIQKHAHGYKAVFLVGNPSNTTLLNVEATIEWGKEYDNKMKDKDYYKIWKQSLHTQAYKVKKSLLKGVWNRVEIILSPATEEELGYISLSLNPLAFNLDIDAR